MQINSLPVQPDNMSDGANVTLLNSAEDQPDSTCQRIARFVSSTLPHFIATAFHSLTTRLFNRQASVLDAYNVMTYTAEAEGSKEATPSDLEFFESFKDNYWLAHGADFNCTTELMDTLKATFPSYFERHPLPGVLLADEVQCDAILEGIVNHYKLDLLKEQTQGMNVGWEPVTTIDNGDCLFDAIWQGLSEEKQHTLTEETGESNYTALKVFLKQKAQEHQQDIMKDSKDSGYESIDEYFSQLDKPEAFWGRHATEGQILAKELGINLVLKGGYSYEATVGLHCFVEREDQDIHYSETNTHTVFISNRKQHYSAIKKSDV